MKTLTQFSIEDFLSASKNRDTREDRDRYQSLLLHVKAALDREWDKTDDIAKAGRLETEKGAIIGIERDVSELKDRIRSIITRENLLSEPYPPYYPDLIDALFSDLYGLSGIAPWAYDWKDEYVQSSSAKLIGDRLYCLIDGKAVLQPQRIPAERRAQLLHALLLASPRERKETGFHEVYLQNGIRVTIFSGERSKAGQDITVFRKYVMKTGSFEALSERGTFPKEAIPLFKAMSRIGFNVVFAGQVRSGKTTFLQTWQSYEDPSLEGVAVATDPETDWSKVSPDAPIMQLVADGEQLTRIEKSLKRSDADYVILEEMRDAVSYSLFLAITNLGTMRSKGTIHDSSAVNIPYKMASSIATELGGSEEAMISQLYTNINYVIVLQQLAKDKSQKRIKEIYEFRYDTAENRVSAQEICRYDPETDGWSWKYDIGKDKLALGSYYPEDLALMKKTLKALEEASPLTAAPLYPSYYRGNVTFREENSPKGRP